MPPRPLLLVLLLIAFRANAQETQPATLPVDASTPQGALKQLAMAMEQGDRELIISSFYAATPQEQKMLETIADMAVELARLHQAAVKAYGQEGAKGITGEAQRDLEESLVRIDAAEVKIDGDNALVVPAMSASAQKPVHVEKPIELKKVNDAWKLSVAQLSHTADPAKLDTQLGAMAAQTQLLREMAEEISAGKYPTPDRADDAWGDKVMQLLMPRSSTQPSTAPATEPAPPTTLPSSLAH